MDSKNAEPTTPKDVATWFAVAVKGQPRGRIPDADDRDVRLLAHHVNLALRRLTPRPDPWCLRKSFNQHMAEHERAQKLATDLAAALPGLIADPLGLRDDGGRAVLLNLDRTLAAAIVVIGTPERKGWASAAWRSDAYTFAVHVARAFRTAGWTALSDETDGPVLRVVQRALKASRRNIGMPALISAMRARPRRGR